MRDSVDEGLWLAVFRRAVLEQDQESWHRIWARFQPVVLRRLRRELAGMSMAEEEIQDLAQEVFLKFWEDTRAWPNVERLYSLRGSEGILSRLHSTAVFAVQKMRQRMVRRWIPLVRRNLGLLSRDRASEVVDLAARNLDARYRPCFLPHLAGRENQEIARELGVPQRDVSIQVNRSWERFLYVLLRHRAEAPAFEPIFRFLIRPPGEDMP